MHTPKDNPRSLSTSTREIYERNAERFDAERSKGLHERKWLDRFLRVIRQSGSVLDLGCGTGDPMAVYIASKGFHVVGLDASPAMLEIARSRNPAGDWRLGDMRDLDLTERFDGILGWDSFFHLTPVEQRATLPRIADHMIAGAALLLTVGPVAGEVIGHVGDDIVYHGSLAPDEYEAILGANGLVIHEFVKEDRECGGHTILLARKS